MAESYMDTRDGEYHPLYVAERGAHPGHCRWGWPADNGHWLPALDGDDRARGIFNRHYSRQHYKDGRKPALFIGPGEKMVLLTAACDAVFGWRKFIDDSGQQGVNCAVFRNEGPLLSSDLILEAEALAAERWPGERFYTYVDARKVASSNPGYCFIKAGWQRCGTTKSGLLILEKQPEFCHEPQTYGYGGYCWRHYGREDTRTQAEYHADRRGWK